MGTSACRRLEKRVVLVTGAGSGIGAASAIRAADEGAQVIVGDIDESGAANTVERINEIGGSARAVFQDTTSETGWQRLIEDIRSTEGALHGLVNNAGIGIAGRITEFSLEEWRQQFGVNVEGVFLGCKHAIPLLSESGAGSIVNISSIAGLKGTTGLSCYSATKGAVRLLTKSVALESASEGWKVRCNSVHPGIIDTAIWEDEKLGGTLEELLPDEMRDAMPEGSNASLMMMIAANTVPGGQHGTAKEVAAGIVFLLSDDASYMTGSELVIDLGVTA